MTTDAYVKNPENEPGIMTLHTTAACSIKDVLLALTGKSYSHLEVSKGDEAARKFLAMTYKGEKMDKSKLRKALLEYCKQDTEGMIEIWRVLEKVTTLPKFENNFTTNQYRHKNLKRKTKTTYSK